ncbi:MAG: NHLP bacteriocin export ABC transporter permease/ATPase subunit, partial [Waterburya sp.]
VGALTTILGMVAPQATGMLIDKAIPDSDRLLLWQIGLALFAAALGKSAFQLSQGIITLRVENATDVNLQLAVWDRLLKITPAFFRQYTSGDLVNRLLAVRQIRSQLSGATQRTLLSGIFSLLNLALMFVYSVKLALIGMGISVLAIIVTITSGILLVRKERQQEKLDGEIDGLTVQLIGGVAKLRVAAAESRAFATWAEKYSQKTKLIFSIQEINDAISTFNEALPLISSVLLFWFAILFIHIAQAKGNPTGLTPGTFLAFNVAFGTFISGVTDLSNTLTDILGIVPLWERAKSLVQAPTEYDPNRTDSGRLAGRLVLDRITFRYREDGSPILDNVSLQANSGEFIAIVGPSGSGKSTLFRLLLGFEMPQSGTIYYDGQDLTGLDVTSVRRQLGVVLQNGRVQQSSIFDNIACGALITLNEAWQAAKMAGLTEDIEQMPMGMHTVVSEGGSNLSGGQRQRLLIARALIGNPKIILMDEATSALDNRTQAIVTQSLETLNTTRIVIAHRLSTIRHADRIYVLEAGRVVQVGSFAELIQQEGLFARLAARQLE